MNTTTAAVAVVVVVAADDSRVIVMLALLTIFIHSGSAVCNMTKQHAPEDGGGIGSS